VAYHLPVNPAAVATILNTSMLAPVSTLETESPWTKQFRQQKQALLKFSQSMTDNLPRTVFLDEYLLYLLEQYLRKEHQKLTAAETPFKMDVAVILKTDNSTFYFQLEEYGPSQSKQEVEDLLLLAVLGCLKFRPSWTLQFY
jgi:hypothetical protein